MNESNQTTKVKLSDYINAYKIVLSHSILYAKNNHFLQFSNVNLHTKLKCHTVSILP